jgi:predicted dehydrogenase
VPLRFAAIGLRIHGEGAIAEVLAAGDTVLVALHEEDAARREEAAGRHGVPGYADWRALLDRERPELVTVCPPHHLKAEIALECLERGVHVLVDKPMALDLDDLARLEAAVRRGRAELQMMLTERFAPPFAALKRLVDEGQLGRVAGVVSLRPHEFALAEREPWMLREELEGGILVDLVIHDADLARWYAGEEFAEVTAYQARKWARYPGFWDVGHALFLTGGGTPVALEADWLTPRRTPWDCRFFLTGTDGAAEVQSLHFSRLSWWRHDGPRTHLELDRTRPDSAGQDLLRRLRGQAPTVLAAADALAATRAVLLARESARSGRRVTCPS